MPVVEVRNNDIEKAIRALKKKCTRNDIFRDLKLCRYFESRGEKLRRKQAESIRRARIGWYAAMKPAYGAISSGRRNECPSIDGCWRFQCLGPAIKRSRESN